MGVGKPREEDGLIVNFRVVGIRGEIFGVGDMEVGVIFNVVDVDVTGFNFSFLDLGGLGGRGSDNVLRNGGIRIGKIGNLVFFGGPEDECGGLGGNVLEEFGKLV